jgi:ACS family glucarate transporter-like MFS transporter
MDRAPAGATKVRWVIVWLAFFGTTVNYVDRANLGAALPAIAEEIQLTAFQQGLVLSAFFWTYAVFQLPAGAAVDRFGARITYTFAAAWWGIFTAATALARNFGSLFALRFLLGVGEAGAYPSNAKAVSRWFPVQERAKATSIYDNGARVGGALALPLVIIIVATIGWRASFVLTGALALLFIVAWWWYYRDPLDHPKVNAQEIDYLRRGGARIEDEPTVSGGREIRYRDLFRYRTVLGMMFGFFCLNFVIYFFITWFPTYLVSERGFSLLKTGFTGLIPPLGALIGGFLGGFVGDRLVQSGMPLTLARKLPIICGMLLGATIIPAAWVPNAYMALVLLAIAYGGLTFAAASIWSLPADVAPTGGHVASIGGMQNFASNAAGIVMPPLLGSMYDATGSFTVPLSVAGCFAVLGALNYLVVVGKVEPLHVRGVEAPHEVDVSAADSTADGAMYEDHHRPTDIDRKHAPR